MAITQPGAKSNKPGQEVAEDEGEESDEYEVVRVFCQQHLGSRLRSDANVMLRSPMKKMRKKEAATQTAPREAKKKR